ncbi:unnamed protein product (macronuclear) [Paramecium tetraurelia]|uniref:Transmembrane protein n=1 Tax=Paramecium tetraurelia TaxID=5888 RepID=A0EGU2_PARTE|nr:uncharacterized protein GSPATT00026857001 [Paramecium tetraurelia]CAK94533.1 unnamed protein product [Paramecium tetraurelia]|eukprot:XP_001461906.1 hypothetical protein (macronuclear) [Paramecium tetraurelia strain d4-2]
MQWSYQVQVYIKQKKKNCIPIQYEFYYFTYVTKNYRFRKKINLESFLKNFARSHFSKKTKLKQVLAIKCLQLTHCGRDQSYNLMKMKNKWKSSKVIKAQKQIIYYLLKSVLNQLFIPQENNRINKIIQFLVYHLDQNS